MYHVYTHDINTKAFKEFIKKPKQFHCVLNLTETRLETTRSTRVEFQQEKTMITSTNPNVPVVYHIHALSSSSNLRISLSRLSNVLRPSYSIASNIPHSGSCHGVLLSPETSVCLAYYHAFHNNAYPLFRERTNRTTVSFKWFNGYNQNLISYHCILWHGVVLSGAGPFTRISGCHDTTWDPSGLATPIYGPPEVSSHTNTMASLTLELLSIKYFDKSETKIYSKIQDQSRSHQP